MARHRKWLPSLKFEIALLAIKGETTLNDICKRYEVAPSQVKAWKKQLLEQGANLFTKNDKAADEAANKLEREQSKLYEKIGQLTVERDFLKKVWGKFQGSNDDS
ncbi:MAG: transposase [Gammaproteobacteria bacterium]